MEHRFPLLVDCLRFSSFDCTSSISSVSRPHPSQRQVTVESTLEGSKRPKRPSTEIETGTATETETEKSSLHRFLSHSRPPFERSVSYCFVFVSYSLELMRMRSGLRNRRREFPREGKDASCRLPLRELDRRWWWRCGSRVVA